LKGLNPVTYTYRAAPDERHVGFIAEDVPDLVATKDRKSLSPMDIVAVLTRVVKVQDERINALEAENQQLKKELLERIAVLERQLKLMNSVASR
jgi:propanediol dehydratase small subunit